MSLILDIKIMFKTIGVALLEQRGHDGEGKDGWIAFGWMIRMIRFGIGMAKSWKDSLREG